MEIKISVSADFPPGTDIHGDTLRGWDVNPEHFSSDVSTYRFEKVYKSFQGARAGIGRLESTLQSLDIRSR